MADRAYPIRKTIYLTAEDARAVARIAAAEGMNDTTYLRGLVRRDVKRRADAEAAAQAPAQA